MGKQKLTNSGKLAYAAKAKKSRDFVCVCSERFLKINFLKGKVYLQEQEAGWSTGTGGNAKSQDLNAVSLVQSQDSVHHTTLPSSPQKRAVSDHEWGRRWLFWPSQSRLFPTRLPWEVTSFTVLTLPMVAHTWSCAKLTQIRRYNGMVEAWTPEN